jgi:hypothetical protein
MEVDDGPIDLTADEQQQYEQQHQGEPGYEQQQYEQEEAGCEQERQEQEAPAEEELAAVEREILQARGCDWLELEICGQGADGPLLRCAVGGRFKGVLGSATPHAAHWIPRPPRNRRKPPAGREPSVCPHDSAPANPSTTSIFDQPLTNL